MSQKERGRRRAGGRRREVDGAAAGELGEEVGDGGPTVCGGEAALTSGRRRQEGCVEAAGRGGG